jgi:hypothetical protein
MSQKQKTPRPLRTVEGVKHVLPKLQSSSNCQKGQEKICGSDHARLRQQQMLEALGKRQEAVEMTHTVVMFGEYLAGRAALHLPDDLAELATLGMLIDKSLPDPSLGLEVMFTFIPGAQERFDVLRREVFYRLGLEVM